ncbi:MAG: HAMP domain-containing histidine kinase [Gemmatimonadetes bacterium]|nr:HAMP domain-containing histidine kinase [Gemmatimonadota bacterium]
MTDRTPAPEGAEALAEQVTQARLATLGMLVAGLAHELNTPLGALNSNHDSLRRALEKLQAILADEVVSPDELEEVRRIVRAVDGILRVNDMAVERMSSLVRDLRNFGRVDRAELDLADLHEGLDSTLAILAHQLTAIEVVREYRPLPRIECRPQQLNQVFMNLLLNARQATPDGGRITIHTGTTGDAIEIRITDTGTGIRPEHLARIFDPGFTTKGNRVGMGLGLLISRQIVERHGGRLLVRSTPGQGATFTVRLPLDPAGGRTGTIPDAEVNS